MIDPNSIKVIVKPIQQQNVRVREGSKNGRDWRMADQKVWIFLDDEFPTEFQITLPQDLQSIQAGEYKLTVQSFKAAMRRGNFDGLTISSQDLIFYPAYDESPIDDHVESEIKPPLFQKSTAKK